MVMLVMMAMSMSMSIIKSMIPQIIVIRLKQSDSRSEYAEMNIAKLHHRLYLYA